MSFSLDRARALIGLDEPDLRARLSAGAEEDADADYQGLEGLVEIRDASLFPGWIYLRDARVELLYTSQLDGVTAADLEAALDGEPEILASRAGKTASMRVRAEQGVAYSVKGDDVQFVEVFRPRSLDAYRDEIYEEPGPFIR